MILQALDRNRRLIVTYKDGRARCITQTRHEVYSISHVTLYRKERGETHILKEQHEKERNRQRTTCVIWPQHITPISLLNVHGAILNQEQTKPQVIKFSENYWFFFAKMQDFCFATNFVEKI